MAASAPTKLPTYYTGLWAMLTLFAVAYMGTVTIRPDLIGEALPSVKLASVLMDEDDQELRRAAGENDALRQQLFTARAELNGLRGELARRSDRETSLSLKLAALEAREAKLAETQAAEAAAAAAKAATAARLAEKAKLAKPQQPAQASPGLSAVERLAAAAGTQPAPASLAQPQKPASPAPIETASIPATQSKPETQAGAAPAAVQLGTGPSVDALRLNWSSLSQRQAALQKLQPRYTTSREGAPGGTGTAYDLIAGPLPSAAEAQKLCESLRAQYVSCRVGTYGGNAL